jgi:Domain of unknown function (DUF4345)
MNAQKIVRISSQIYMGLSILSLMYVSLLSLYSPQTTMSLVSTPLPNTDAVSSIRGIYGGVGLVITITLIYLLLNDLQKGLVFLAFFWFSYAISRLITIWVDGPLGDFGSQWIRIESGMAFVALVLLLLFRSNRLHIQSH